MYEDAMNAIHQHLIQESSAAHLIYTAELNPERNPLGEMSVFPSSLLYVLTCNIQPLHLVHGAECPSKIT